MSLLLESVNTQDELPSSSTVVIIGGGIVGVTAALTLAERNIPVVLLEKGHIAGEQSSRNLGWIRKTSRHANDVPLAQAADRLWADLPSRIDRDVGYKQQGIMFLSSSEEEHAGYEAWLKSVEHLSLGSRMLSTSEIEQHAPGGKGNWVGAIHTPSDGVAEPAIATSAMASAAVEKGAIIVQNCAVRTLSREGGKVTGVMTEKGEIKCEQVLLAGGIWSPRYLSQLGAFRKLLRIKVGKPFIDDIKLARRWKGHNKSPFEHIRTMDPAANPALNKEAMTNLCNAWPIFENAEIDEAWAGRMDITPDSTPVIDKIESIPGLSIASGFSGHGFGTGPAAGQLAADILTNETPIVDPSPYRFGRF